VRAEEDAIVAARRREQERLQRDEVIVRAQREREDTYRRKSLEFAHKHSLKLANIARKNEEKVLRTAESARRTELKLEESERIREEKVAAMHRKVMAENRLRNEENEKRRQAKLIEDERNVREKERETKERLDAVDRRLQAAQVETERARREKVVSDKAAAVRALLASHSQPASQRSPSSPLMPVVAEAWRKQDLWSRSHCVHLEPAMGLMWGAGGSAPEVGGEGAAARQAGERLGGQRREEGGRAHARDEPQGAPAADPGGGVPDQVRDQAVPGVHGSQQCTHGCCVHHVVADVWHASGVRAWRGEWPITCCGCGGWLVCCHAGR
jgi:hypothetical protein